MFIIEISEFILVCSDDAIRNVMAHEVLHTCDGCYDHGIKWKEYAGRMNRAYGYRIKRTSSFSDMGLEEPGRDDSRIRYIIKCRRCGREYPTPEAHKSDEEDKFIQVQLRRQTVRHRCQRRKEIMKYIPIKQIEDTGVARGLFTSGGSGWWPFRGENAGTEIPEADLANYRELLPSGHGSGSYEPRRSEAYRPCNDSEAGECRGGSDTSIGDRSLRWHDHRCSGNSPLHRYG